jgi:hypothetical protein
VCVCVCVCVYVCVCVCVCVSVCVNVKGGKQSIANGRGRYEEGTLTQAAFILRYTLSVMYAVFFAFCGP